MHIVLALAGAIITILILVRRLGDAGITLDSFNPFAWYRKHQWLKKYHSKPLFTIEDPQKAAALLIVAIAKADGMISLEEKNQILKLFEEEFGHNKEDASGLFTSSAFFLKDEEDIAPYLSKILDLSGHKFSANQVNFTLSCMEKIAALSGDNASGKGRIITEFKKYFDSLNKKNKFDSV